MPYAPRPDDGGVRHKYQTPTSPTATVAEYTGLTIAAVGELPLEDFLLLRRDAVIARLSRTEAGVEYLNDAWAREQTEPDLNGLWKMFGGR